jgi:hypothetical protein
MIDMRDDGDIAKFLSHAQRPAGKPTIIASKRNARS